MDIFMDGLSISFDDCLTNLEKVLERYREKHLSLNWEQCHFMARKGIILDRVISSDGIEVKEAKFFNC